MVNLFKKNTCVVQGFLAVIWRWQDNEIVAEAQLTNVLWLWHVLVCLKQLFQLGFGNFLMTACSFDIRCEPAELSHQWAVSELFIP